MAEAREPPKKGAALVIWPILNAGAVRAYLLVRAIATLRGIMEPSEWARVLSVEPRGRRADAGGRYA